MEEACDEGAAGEGAGEDDGGEVGADGACGGGGGGEGAEGVEGVDGVEGYVGGAEEELVVGRGGGGDVGDMGGFEGDVEEEGFHFGGLVGVSGGVVLNCEICEGS